MEVLQSFRGCQGMVRFGEGVLPLFVLQGDIADIQVESGSLLLRFHWLGHHIPRAGMEWHKSDLSQIEWPLHELTLIPSDDRRLVLYRSSVAGAMSLMPVDWPTRIPKDYVRGLGRIH